VLLTGRPPRGGAWIEISIVEAGYDRSPGSPPTRGGVD